MPNEHLNTIYIAQLNTQEAQLNTVMNRLKSLTGAELGGAEAEEEDI